MSQVINFVNEISSSFGQKLDEKSHVVAVVVVVAVFVVVDVDIVAAAVAVGNVVTVLAFQLGSESHKHSSYFGSYLPSMCKIVLHL